MEELMLKEGGFAATLTRPDVPYDLGDEEAEEWRRIVNCMPADHFIPANYHVLGLLCHHIIEARRISLLIRRYCGRKERLEVKIYLDLCKHRMIESAAVLQYSRQCRLTHQSTFSKKAVKLTRIAAQQVDMSDEPGWK